MRNFWIATICSLAIAFGAIQGVRSFEMIDGVETVTGAVIVSPTITGAAITSSTYDGGTVGDTTPITTLDVDNINVNGNAVTSTDTNGNIAITPNGSGEVDISKVDVDSGAIDGVTIGTTTPATQAIIDNIDINGNTIISTDTDGAINLTPNGTGNVVISKIDANSGTIDGATIATSDVTVGAGKTLDVSAGTLTLADNQVSGNKVEGGTIASTTITTLTTTSVTDGTATLTGGYLTGLQNVPEILANGPGYWFNGFDDKVTITDNVDIDFGTGDFSIVSIAKINGGTGRGYLADKISTQRYSFGHLNGILEFRINDGTAANYTFGSTDIRDSHRHVFVLVADRSSNASAYIDGSVAASIDISARSSDIDNAGNLIVGAASSDSAIAGELFSTKIFNLVLDNTDATDKAIINGGAVPFTYIGASQTVLTSGTLTIGKKYRIVNWITDDDFTNIGGTNEDGNEFTATGATPTKWTNSSTVVQIGCVLDLSPEGVTNSSWVDASGNDLDGTVSGAVAINLPKTLQLANTTAEDSDGGRDSFVSFSGKQSGGEVTTLAKITASHDGASDDQKGKIAFFTNDGSDGDVPTDRGDFDSAGTLTTTAGRVVNITTVNAATYDTLVSDYIINVTYTATAAVTSLTIPTAQFVEGRVIMVKDAGGLANTNNITIDTEGAQTIDGAATAVINTNYASVSMYCDGSNLFIF